MEPYVSPAKFIGKIRIYLTLECNLNCSYCVNAQFGESGRAHSYALRSAREWAQAINRIGKDVIFTGGEPTLYPELYALLEMISPERSITIYTNLKFDVHNFIENVKRKLNFYISYHPCYGDHKKFIKDYKIFSSYELFNCSLHMISWEKQNGFLSQLKQDFINSGIELKLDKDQLQGFVGCTQQFRVKAKCRRKVILVSPDGKRYPCVSKIIRKTGGMENIINSELGALQCEVLCEDYGYCAACDGLGETAIYPL